jgi:hypothetical protein
MKHLGFVIIFFLLAQGASAQEFNFKVELNTQQVQNLDPSVITSLKTAMTEFLNNRKWTNYNFKTGERIECTLLFNIQQIVGSDQFTGTFNIIMERPVYHADYHSPLLNMIDKDIRFRYTPSQSMNFVQNSYTNNLTSLLAYYAYMILGIDFDTFSPDGGTPFYQQAMSIVQSAQNSGEPGWTAGESTKDRYHFVEQMLNKAYEPLRQFLYQYHRLGLDVMAGDVASGRKAVLASLQDLRQVYEKRPGLYDLQLILDAKRNELIQMFSQAPESEKSQMVDTMSLIDPANGNRYRSVLANQ